MLEQKSFQRDKVVRCLDANKHNHETTSYYLILKKLERESSLSMETDERIFPVKYLLACSLYELKQNDNIDIFYQLLTEQKALMIAKRKKTNGTSKPSR